MIPYPGILYTPHLTALVTDTIYSVANSVNLDGIPSDLDQWNFGPNFLITVTEDIIPIELVSFNAMIMDKRCDS